MDYKILLSNLQSKETELGQLQSEVNNILEESRNDLNSINGTEISSLYSKVEVSINRLEKGYDNCDTWLDDYINELDSLENSLANFNNSNIDTPVEFKEGFPDLFGKRVIPLLKSNGDQNMNLDLGEKGSGLSSQELENVLAAAKSQENVTPYCTMTYEPDGGGFGCAMFVSYCYNQALFNGARGDDWDTPGFYGSTYEYWGNVTNDDYNAHNKGFKEVSAEEAQPGDVVCYTEGSDPYATHEACRHVALYTGDGQILGSWGSGTSGPGVISGTVESQAYGNGDTMRDIHYLHYVGQE